MYPANQPLQNLAAFAIVFVAGVMSTITLGKYIKKLKADVASVVLHS